MKNNTFYIVFRKGDHREVIPNDSQDRWGWEFADGVEIFDYKEAQRLREEYQSAMTGFCVHIRCVPTKVGLYSESDIMDMRPKV